MADQEWVGFYDCLANHHRVIFCLTPDEATAANCFTSLASDFAEHYGTAEERAEWERLCGKFLGIDGGDLQPFTATIAGRRFVLAEAEWPPPHPPRRP